jgi:hypothetical protein
MRALEILPIVLVIWVGVAFGLHFLNRRAPVAERKKRHLIALVVNVFFATAVFYLEFNLTVRFFLMTLLFAAVSFFVYRWVQFCGRCGSPTRWFLFSPVPTHCPKCGLELNASAHP